MRYQRSSREQKGWILDEFWPQLGTTASRSSSCCAGRFLVPCCHPATDARRCSVPRTRRCWERAGKSPTTDVRATYWPRRLEQSETVFERAVTRGDLAATADQGLAVELLLAPLYFRLLITQAPLDAAFTDHLIQAILRALH